MATTKTTDWAERVRRWRASGESVRRFAEREGCSEASMRYWARRVAQPSASRVEGPRLVQLVTSAEAATLRRAEVVLDVGRVSIRVHAGFDAKLLTEVIAALSGGV